MAKRTQKELLSDQSDGNTTPTNKKAKLDSDNPQDSEDDTTPIDELNDITDMKHTLDLVERKLRGQDIPDQELENIKEEYGSYFDESNFKSDKNSLEEIKEYLEGELSESLNKASLLGLNEALENILQGKDVSNHKIDQDNKTDQDNEASTSKSASETVNSTSKPSTGQSPIDYVLDKQSMEPFDPTEDLG